MKYRLMCVLVMMIALFVFVDKRKVIANEMPVGEITETRGPVAVVKDDGRQIKAEKGTPLFPGDLVTTGKGGLVWFSFKQGRSI